MAAAHNRRFAGILYVFFFLSQTNPVWASVSTTPQEDLKFLSLVWVTIVSAVGSGILSLYYFRNATANDWNILLRCVASISLVTFLCFYLSIIPLLEQISLQEALFVLYMPAVVTGSMLVATGMWLRTLVQEHQFSLEPSEIRMEFHRLRRRADHWMRDHRIQRAVSARRRRLVKR